MNNMPYNVIGIVPSYQPDDKLVDTLSQTIQELPSMPIVVVDDGGGDNFRCVFERVSQLTNVTVLHHGANAGKGAGIKTALQYALWKFPDSIGCVVFDGDGQHAPKDVRRVVEASVANPSRLILGVRDFHNSKLDIPLRSRFGNRLTEIIFRAFTGIKLIDTQTGLRVYPRSLAESLTQVKSNRYEFELEALLIAARQYDYFQIPIETIYEDGNRCSHFNPVWDSIRIYSVFFKFIGATAVCSLVDYIIFAIVYAISSVVLPSMAVARVISVALNFVLNRNKVFHSKGSIRREMVGFAVLAVFLFSASYLGVSACKNVLGISPFVSKVLVELGLFVLSFIVQRCIIFTKRAGR